MKWDIIKKEWEYKEPKFWSKCTFFHHHKNGLYFPDELNCICIDCHIWWAKRYHNRHDKSMPPMFDKRQISLENPTGINYPFYYIEGEAGIKPNPEYTEGEYRKWLNGKGVALKRERYPDD